MEEERGDPRWRAALEVLDRVNTSATPGRRWCARGSRSWSAKTTCSCGCGPGPQEPVAAREVEVARALLDGRGAGDRAGGRPGPALARRRVRRDRLALERHHRAGHAGAPRAAWPGTCGSAPSATYAFDVPRFDPLTAIRNAVAGAPDRRPAGRLRPRAGAGAVRRMGGDRRPRSGRHRGRPRRPPRRQRPAHRRWPAAHRPGAGRGRPAVLRHRTRRRPWCERYGADPSTLDAFLEAQEHDPRSWPGFATCLAVYELWVTAWAVGVRDRSPELAAEAAVRIGCLRDQSGEPWHLH